MGLHLSYLPLTNAINHACASSSVNKMILSCLQLYKSPNSVIQKDGGKKALRIPHAR